jgi:hypothetical protein
MRTLRIGILAAAVLATGSAAFAQAQPNVALQREAMKRLAFLVGQWQGDATVTLGPGGPIRLRQTEHVQFKLDGLLLLIEGTGRDAATGAVSFNALATISFDEATKTYRFRAHNDGRYLDTELVVGDRSFEWGYTAGPAKITNKMSLDADGRWVEFTEAVVNNSPPMRMVEIRVSK